jgi:hypothetical protein
LGTFGFSKKKGNYPVVLSCSSYKEDIMSTVTSATITWVNDVPSTSGKTIKVYLTAPSWDPKVTHFAWVPTSMAPAKFDVIEATTIKLGDIETEYEDDNKKMVALKNARRQVSFFGSVAIVDGPELPATEWVDRRNRKAPDADNAF